MNIVQVPKHIKGRAWIFFKSHSLYREGEPGFYRGEAHNSLKSYGLELGIFSSLTVYIEPENMNEVLGVKC